MADAAKNTKKTVVTDEDGLTMTFNESKAFDKDRKCRFYATYPERHRLAGEIRVDSHSTWNELVKYYNENVPRFGRKRRIEILSNLAPSYDTMFMLGAAIEKFIGLP